MSDTRAPKHPQACDAATPCCALGRSREYQCLRKLFRSQDWQALNAKNFLADVQEIALENRDLSGQRHSF